MLVTLTAIAHPLRLRIIAELTHGRVHVSELARRLGTSRPLLYMHLDKLEKAEMVTGHLELTEDGKAMKYFELAPFELRVTADTIVDALRKDLRSRRRRHAAYARFRMNALSFHAGTRNIRAGLADCPPVRVQLTDGSQFATFRIP